MKGVWLHGTYILIYIALYIFKTSYFPGNSLVVQWLGPGALTAEALSSVPGGGTKIPQATWCSQKYIYIYIFLLPQHPHK